MSELAAGSFVRTHIARATWHFVAAEDLRWILRLTSPKVESGMGARHRQLELDDRAIDRGIDILRSLLHGHVPHPEADRGTGDARSSRPG